MEKKLKAEKTWVLIGQYRLGGTLAKHYDHKPTQDDVTEFYLMAGKNGDLIHPKITEKSYWTIE